MKLQNLNGWQRLWVVVAAIALVFALLSAFVNAAKENSPNYSVISAYKNPSCQFILKLPKGFELDSPPEYDSPCYDLYVEMKYSDLHPKNADEYRAQVSKRYWQSLLAWLGVSIVMWAMALGLLYGAGATVAWVRRGFGGT